MEEIIFWKLFAIAVFIAMVLLFIFTIWINLTMNRIKDKELK